MNSETPLTRRGWLAAIGGCAGVGAVAGFAARLISQRSLATPIPPLALPPQLGPLVAKRLHGLHARYAAVRTSKGVPAMRRQIVADLRGFNGHAEWQHAIVSWIEYGGWSDAADLLVDAAELGGLDLRRNVASSLSTRATGLLMTNGCGPRIVRLADAETDALAAEYWRDLRRTLGI